MCEHNDTYVCVSVNIPCHVKPSQANLHASVCSRQVCTCVHTLYRKTYRVHQRIYTNTCIFNAYSGPRKKEKSCKSRSLSKTRLNNIFFQLQSKAEKMLVEHANFCSSVVVISKKSSFPIFEVFFSSKTLVIFVFFKILLLRTEVIVLHRIVFEII